MSTATKWNRSQLIFELGRALPSLPPDVDPLPYFDELAAEALPGRAEGVSVIQVAPVPDVIDVSRLGFRKDGTSIYRPPGEERFVSKEHLDHEQYLVDVAAMPVRRRVTPEAADAALAGTDLDYSQRAAVKGLLTSGRLISCLVAPAGTGKTYVMAAFARIWAAETGCRVLGLTASENAARVLAGEGMTETYNIAKFLGKIRDSDETRGHVPEPDRRMTRRLSCRAVRGRAGPARYEHLTTGEPMTGPGHYLRPRNSWRKPGRRSASCTFPPAAPSVPVPARFAPLVRACRDGSTVTLAGSPGRDSGDRRNDWSSSKTTLRRWGGRSPAVGHGSHRGFGCRSAQRLAAGGRLG